VPIPNTFQTHISQAESLKGGGANLDAITTIYQQIVEDVFLLFTKPLLTCPAKFCVQNNRSKYNLAFYLL
jgi:hypothetical protein